MRNELAVTATALTELTFVHVQITVYRTLQQPGEFIVTMPGAYHGGFSTGLNIGEAVNFASAEWLQFGQKCRVVYGKTKFRIPVFPLEWIVIQNI